MTLVWLGRLAEAEQWLERAQAARKEERGRDGIRIAAAALELADGRPAEAVDELRPLIDASAPARCRAWGTAIEARLYDALARRDLGDAGGAEASLQRGRDGRARGHASRDVRGSHREREDDSAPCVRQQDRRREARSTGGRRLATRARPALMRPALCPVPSGASGRPAPRAVSRPASAPGRRPRRGHPDRDAGVDGATRAVLHRQPRHPRPDAHGAARTGEGDGGVEPAGHGMRLHAGRVSGRHTAGVIARATPRRQFIQSG
jgi:hypothetical protein